MAVQAQASDSPHSIQWWEAGLAVGGVTVLILVDQSVKEWAQDQRSQSTDDAADVFRHVGQPEVWIGVPAVIVGAGLISGSEHTTAVGVRALGSALLAGAVELSLKTALGAAGRTSPMSASGISSRSAEIRRCRPGTPRWRSPSRRASRMISIRSGPR
jgi:hypothetical protein